MVWSKIEIQIRFKNPQKNGGLRPDDRCLKFRQLVSAHILSFQKVSSPGDRTRACRLHALFPPGRTRGASCDEATPIQGKMEGLDKSHVA